MVLTTSSSHEEGVERRWAILTKEFLGDSRGRLQGLKVVDIQWVRVVTVRWALMKFRDGARHAL